MFLYLGFKRFNHLDISRSVFEQPGLELRPEEDQAGVSLGGGLREQHAVLHEHRAGAPPGPMQARVNIEEGGLH